MELRDLVGNDVPAAMAEQVLWGSVLFARLIDEKRPRQLPYFC